MVLTGGEDIQKGRKYLCEEIVDLTIQERTQWIIAHQNEIPQAPSRKIHTATALRRDEKEKQYKK